MAKILQIIPGRAACQGGELILFQPFFDTYPISASQHECVQSRRPIGNIPAKGILTCMNELFFGTQHSAADVQQAEGYGLRSGTFQYCVQHIMRRARIQKDIVLRHNRGGYGQGIGHHLRSLRFHFPRL